MLCRPAAVSRSSLGSLEQGLGVAARLKIDARNLTRRPGGRHRSAASERRSALKLVVFSSVQTSLPP